MIFGLAILIILCIVEIVMFALTIVPGGIDFLLYLGVHTVIVLFFYFINRSLQLFNKNMVPLLFVYIFPGAGFFIIYFLELLKFILRPKKNPIDEITIVSEDPDKDVFNFLEEEKTLSYIDNVKLADTDDIMAFIFDVLDNEEYDQIKILTEIHNSGSDEAKYYSSVYLSSASKTFEEEIFLHREEYDKTKSSRDLLRLLALYDRYLKSGLLKDEIYLYTNSNYINYLKIAIDEDIDIQHNYQYLIDAYIEQREYEMAYHTLTDCMKAYPNVVEFAVLKVKLFYKMRKFDSLKQYAKDVMVTYSDITPKQQSILEFWAGNL